jgi:thymidylate synthase ThyX
MAYAADILSDCISPEGHRLTTFELTLPRIVLAEFNTHRMVSRNSGSSRAVPISVTIKGVQANPFIPDPFLSHQKGMVAGEPLEDQEWPRHLWKAAMEAAMDYAQGLHDAGVSKGISNRPLEPYKWHTIIATATDWSNFFALRTAKDAQAEIRIPAGMMKELYDASSPRHLAFGEWAMPLVSMDEFYDGDRIYEYWKAVSVGRVARVSYERQHDGGEPDSDVARCNRLIEGTNRHLSPFEHVARPFSAEEWQHVGAAQTWGGDSPFLRNMARNMEYAGNLHGWWSYRMDIHDQDDYQKVLNALR